MEQSELDKKDIHEEAIKQLILENTQAIQIEHTEFYKYFYDENIQDIWEMMHTVELLDIDTIIE